jgi:hypothetical protein
VKQRPSGSKSSVRWQKAELVRDRIDELFADGTLIDQALRRAVQEALLSHRQTGHPIVVWQDGKVVWVPPEEIVVENLPEPDKSNGPSPQTPDGPSRRSS